MNPRKPRTAIKQTAEKCNVSEQLVSDLTHFFWIKVRREMSSLDHVRVHAQNFGTFTVRYKQLEKSIQKTSEILERLDKEKYSEYDKFSFLSQKLEKLRILVQTLKDEWVERSEHYETKNTNRGSEDSMEESEIDS